MPELPEIFHLGRTLEPALTGVAIAAVDLRRPDIVRQGSGRTRRSRRRVGRGELLAGGHVDRLVRHGKELALVAGDGRAVCVHLGMTGGLRVCPPGRRIDPADHVHCVWRLRSRGRPAGRLVFRDPRRFGGLWTYESVEHMYAERWNRLGPDALTIAVAQLRPRLARTRRAIKAALLDQTLVAGIGNIYADEILFETGIHPMMPAVTLPADTTRRLAAATRRILRRAIDCGGSTIRDYADGQGVSGSYASRHQVYGRGGEACPRCGHELHGAVVGQRTTVFCPCCQRL